MRVEADRHEAGLDPPTEGGLKGRGTAALSSGLDAVSAVQRALEAAGVEFLNHGRPGVRFRATRPDEGLRPDQLTTEND